MNIGRLLTKAAVNFPTNLAVAQGSTELSYSQFNQRANSLAAGLQRLGVGKSSNVSLLMYNRPEMLESMFACFKLGAAAVPLNFRLHPSEIAFIVDNSQSKVLLFSSEFAPAVRGIREQIPRAGHLIGIGELDDPEGLVAYESLLAERGSFEDVDVSPDDVAWIFYTSGTTGRPKGAMLTHRNLLAMTMNFYTDIAPGFGPTDVVLHAAPLSHGSGCYALPNVGKAAANIIPESHSFDAMQVLKTIQDRRVTNMFVAPTMIRLLLDCPAFDQYDVSSLRAMNYGGAPMLVEDLIEAMDRLGACLVQLYGQAESPMTISYLPHHCHVPTGSVEDQQRLASAGIARTDVELKIFDTQGRELPAGEMGEIVTRSDVVMKGYWGNPEATAETLRNGWLHTGDLGYLDEQGYLFIMDRSKDMIISGGENIYPREIEEVIIRHPSVREVAVVGTPDDTWGEAVTAVVSLIPGQSVSQEDLIDFCQSHIASYKKPKAVDFVDELPKNNYGKVLKRELRDRYWKGKQRLI